MRITFITFLMLVTNCIFAQFSGKGTGTSDDPYQITTADELFEVRNALNASYKLMNDIDLTDWIAENNPTQGWVPIGTESMPFTGVFNGNGMKIRGVYINRPSTNNIGLFGYVGYPGIIMKITLEAPNITGCNNIGAIVGYSYGDQLEKYNVSTHPNICSNIVLRPTIKGFNCVGGIVGCSLRTILNRNCIVSPNIEGDNYVGGIAGINYSYDKTQFGGSTDSISYNNVTDGIIHGTEDVGGIMGYSSHKYQIIVKNRNICSVYVVSNHCSSQIYGSKNVGGICGRINSPHCLKSTYNVNTQTWSSASEDCEYIRHYVYNNLFSGSVISHGNASAGIIGYGDFVINLASNYSIKTTPTIKSGLSLSKNICSGCVYSDENSSGVFGYMPTEVHVNGSTITYSAPTSLSSLTENIFCGDTLSSLFTESQAFRISAAEGSSNYALSTSTLLIDGQSYVIEEDNAQQGVGYGRKTLMKQSTYEGLGFDFKNDWAIVEGETYPYNINQCRPATVTSFKSGTSGTIEGTAIGKSSQCNGNVYVSIGDYFYEGTVTNGQWTVLLGEVKVGAVAKVTVMVDGMMPSILTTAIAEKGSSTTPVVDNTPDTDISALSDVVYINNVEASVGTQLTLSVKMKNAVTAEGFGFDLYLPDGVTVARDKEGFPMVELSTERTTSRKTNSFDAAFQSDGSLRVLAASTNGSAINGNDGEVCLITINPNRSLGPISSGDVKVFSCPPESKECLPLIYGSHKT